MIEVSSSLIGRSSARFSLVSVAERTIHHCPRIFTKLRPISSAAKFFRLIGQKASNATINPLRIRQALASLVSFSERSASSISFRPASARTSINTRRSNFERGRATSARSLPISASQVKSRGSGVLSQFFGAFGLVYKFQAGLRENFDQCQTVELGAWPRYER